MSDESPHAAVEDSPLVNTTLEHPSNTITNVVAQQHPTPPPPQPKRKKPRSAWSTCRKITLLILVLILLYATRTIHKVWLVLSGLQLHNESVIYEQWIKVGTGDSPLIPYAHKLKFDAYVHIEETMSTNVNGKVGVAMLDAGSAKPKWKSGSIHFASGKKLSERVRVQTRFTIPWEVIRQNPTPNLVAVITLKPTGPTTFNHAPVYLRRAVPLTSSQTFRLTHGEEPCIAQALTLDIISGKSIFNQNQVAHSSSQSWVVNQDREILTSIKRTESLDLGPEDDHLVAVTKQNTLPYCPPLMLCDKQSAPITSPFASIIKFDNKTPESKYLPFLLHFPFRTTILQQTPLTHLKNSTQNSSNPYYHHPLHITLQPITPQRAVLLSILDTSHSTAKMLDLLNLDEINAIERWLNALVGAWFSWSWYFTGVLLRVQFVSPYMQFWYLFTRYTSFGVSQRGLLVLIGAEIVKLGKREWNGTGGIFGTFCTCVTVYTYWTLGRFQFSMSGWRLISVNERKMSDREKRSEELDRAVMSELGWQWVVALGIWLSSVVHSSSSSAIDTWAYTTFLLIQHQLNEKTGHWAGHYRPFLIIPVICHATLLAFDLFNGRLSFEQGFYNVVEFLQMYAAWQAWTLPVVSDDDEEEE